MISNEFAEKVLQPAYQSVFSRHYESDLQEDLEDALQESAMAINAMKSDNMFDPDPIVAREQVEELLESFVNKYLVEHQPEDHSRLHDNISEDGPTTLDFMVAIEKREAEIKAWDEVYSQHSWAAMYGTGFLRVN